MQWLDEFIKSRKAKNNLEAGTGNRNPEIETDSKDNNDNTPHLSDLPDLQEPFKDQGLRNLFNSGGEGGWVEMSVTMVGRWQKF